jgi:hypothetical protein
VKSGIVGCTIFQLPLGYRPAARRVFAVISAGSLGRLDILGQNYMDPGYRGMVIAYSGSTTYYSLNGITFRCGPSGADGCP